MTWDVCLIFFVLGVVVPWRGRLRLRELLAKPHVGTRERVSLYVSTIAFQWVTTGIVGWRAWARGFTVAQLGLAAHGGSKVAFVGVLGAGILGILHWLNLRRMGRLPTKTRGTLQALAERILPQSPIEIPPFLALAVTAGVCEEFLYRGFALAVFDRVGSRAQ
jgi:membrane protease YdiL (CAAX protease family)